MDSHSRVSLSAEATISLRETAYDVCFDEYAAIVAPLFETSSIITDIGKKRSKISAWESDVFLFSEIESGRFSRTLGRKEIQDFGHMVEISRYAHGGEQGIIGDTVLDRVPGPIYIADKGIGMRGVAHDFQVQQMFVPKTCLGFQPDQLVRGTTVQCSHPSGLMLHTCMTELFETAKANRDSIPEDLFSRLIALLKVNLGVDPQREDVRTQLRKSLFGQICIFIEQNLSDTSLSAETILRSFGVSRASLYRMFEDHGGVRTYVTRRRVARAVLEIEEDPYTRGRMRQVAERWGFSSQPNFNRTIQRLFGTSPSGLFKSTRTAQTVTSEDGSIMSNFATRTAAAA